MNFRRLDVLLTVTLVTGATLCLGAPPPGKGGGGDPEPSEPVPGYNVWFEDATNLDTGSPDYFDPGAPQLTTDTAVCNGRNNGNHDRVVMPRDMLTDFVQVTWNDNFRCDSPCNECLVMWPTVDAAGTTPTAFPLNFAPLLTTLVDGAAPLTISMDIRDGSGKKAGFYKIIDVAVQGIANTADGFELQIRQDAIPVYEVARKGALTLFGYISIGDIRYDYTNCWDYDAGQAVDDTECDAGRELPVWPSGAAARLAPTRSADLNGDGRVSDKDLAALLGAWTERTPCAAGDADCARADLNRDGVVNLDDLLLLLGHGGAGAR